jgi:hypothetical protein
MCQKIGFVLDSAHELLKIAMDQATAIHMISLNWHDDIRALKFTRVL